MTIIDTDFIENEQYLKQRGRARQSEGFFRRLDWTPTQSRKSKGTQKRIKISKRHERSRTGKTNLFMYEDRQEYDYSSYSRDQAATKKRVQMAQGAAARPGRTGGAQGRGKGRPNR